MSGTDMVPDDPTAPPLSVVYDHCKRVYDAMYSLAKLRDVGEEQILVYEGHLTRLIKEDLNYSTPYYTIITGHLKRMRCIEMVRRGGGTASSVWRLLKEPNEEDFKTSKDQLKPGNRPQDMVAQQLRDINTRLMVVEKALGIR